MDYEKIKKTCDVNSEWTGKLIENFLIPYAAKQDHLEREFNMRLHPYRHITSTLKQDWIPVFTSQYIAHRLFRKDGLIGKYLNHSSLQKLTSDDLTYLRHKAEDPWRFSFSEILSNPSDDFYLMMDVFTSEVFLLYSPGIANIQKSQQVMLWFNLISYNGVCWQSFGPILPYSSFESDDIFYFATTLNPDIETEEDLFEDLENNPVPYLMLISGSQLPAILHKNDQVIYLISEFDAEDINTETLRKDFIIEYNEGVYRLSLKRWGGHPHFSTAYYDENKKLLIPSAMTDRGYETLITRLNQYGLELPEEPFIRVSPAMLSTCGEILGVDTPLAEYESLFTKEVNEAESEQVAQLNDFMNLYFNEVNAGRSPDIEQMAKKTGVDPETAKDVVKEVMKNFNDKFK